RLISSKALKEFDTKISEHQKMIINLISENKKLKSQTYQLKSRIHVLETEYKVTNNKQITEEPIEQDEMPQEKIVISYYSYEKKIHDFFTSNQVTDQLLLKMILLIETSLNSVKQIQTLQIIGDRFLQDGKFTLVSDVSEFIRVSAKSFNNNFLPLSNERIRKLGTRTLHCEILEQSFNDDLIPVYKPTDLGERFFKIKAAYFDEIQVKKRIQSSFGRNLIAEKGKELFKVVLDHYIENNRPVTRQELFNQYNLGKYEIDTFKHHLIEVGLIKKVPLPFKERYNQHRRILRCETALQPRHLEIAPKDLN
ncbi:MAG: hypothetical protein ACXADY_23375, partial [Candidatus Hodarchaeales archaeon]